jgi:hypothetical protein
MSGLRRRGSNRHWRRRGPRTLLEEEGNVSTPEDAVAICGGSHTERRTEAAEACAGMRRIGGHESRESMRLPMAAVGDLQNRGEEE